MTVECERCKYIGGISEALSGIGHMITRLIPLAVWMGIAFPTVKHVARTLPPGAFYLSIFLAGTLFLFFVRAFFLGRITQL